VARGGVEIADDMLARARSKFAPYIETGRLQLERGSLTSLPLDDSSLDAAITANTLYFVPELDAACTELARVLRPDGQVVVGMATQTSWRGCRSCRRASRCVPCRT
jgi:arsenite methyltransferase